MIFFKKMPQIQVKNFKIDKDNFQKIQEKSEKLLHLARDMSDESTSIKIDFEIISKSKGLFSCHITAHVPHPGEILRSEAIESSALNAMDKAEQKIRSQIEKHKNRRK